MKYPCLIAVLSWATAGLCSAADHTSPRLDWRAAQRQPQDWYGSQEAARIADNLLLYQRHSGGWPKNIDMATDLDESARNQLRAAQQKTDGTIDNGATCSQLVYLARTSQATGMARFQKAFYQGLDFLLQAQYPNGGWPQFYPDPKGYHAHITFNDNAMINVMTLLQNVSRAQEPFLFVDQPNRDRCTLAVAKGVDCILKCQVKVNDHRTAWCAQHHASSLQPAPARSYEHPSLSGSESVNIVRFLMQLNQPDPAVIRAIQSAVAWFDQAKILGIRQVQKPNPDLPKGYDKVIVTDPDAPPLWARFYEIGSNRPIFSGRDGVIRYRLEEIEHERRVGYSWYTTGPAALLEHDYPTWQKRWAPSRNVLNANP